MACHVFDSSPSPVFPELSNRILSYQSNYLIHKDRTCVLCEKSCSLTEPEKKQNLYQKLIKQMEQINQKDRRKC